MDLEKEIQIQILGSFKIYHFYLFSLLFKLFQNLNLNFNGRNMKKIY